MVSLTANAAHGFEETDSKKEDNHVSVSKKMFSFHLTQTDVRGRTDKLKRQNFGGI